MITKNLFAEKVQRQKEQLFLAAFFPLFTILALGIDSAWFAQHYFDARDVTNFLSVTYFFLMFQAAGSHLRKLMFVMLFLSYVGEVIFCKLLGMYSYRTEAIPLYVPFGHSIVYASGYIFAHSSFAFANEGRLKVLFPVFFSLLFLGVGLFAKDVFSLLFGLCFFLLLKRKRWENLYYFIALCVIFIELVGTSFRCWTWVPETFDLFPTANPPMGAVFFYAGGDVLLAKIVSVFDNRQKISA